MILIISSEAQIVSLQHPTTMNEQTTTFHAITYVRNKLKQYNWFPSYNPTAYELKTQLISTRISIILLFMALLVLLIFNSTVITLKKNSITSSSFDPYKVCMSQTTSLSKLFLLYKPSKISIVIFSLVLFASLSSHT